MMLNLIVVFVVAGLLLHFFNWRKTGIVLIGLAAIFYGAIASAILPDTLMSRLQSAYSSQLQTQLEDNTCLLYTSPSPRDD